MSETGGDAASSREHQQIENFPRDDCYSSILLSLILLSHGNRIPHSTAGNFRGTTRHQLLVVQTNLARHSLAGMLALESRGTLSPLCDRN